VNRAEIVMSRVGDNTEETLTLQLALAGRPGLPSGSAARCRRSLKKGLQLHTETRSRMQWTIWMARRGRQLLSTTMWRLCVSRWNVTNLHVKMAMHVYFVHKLTKTENSQTGAWPQKLLAFPTLTNSESAWSWILKDWECFLSSPPCSAPNIGILGYWGETFVYPCHQSSCVFNTCFGMTSLLFEVESHKLTQLIKNYIFRIIFTIHWLQVKYNYLS
jgi:hypothetical protein